ncbi:hypothetical protein T265_04236, partial [Opisthorchis viverrini]
CGSGSSHFYWQSLCFWSIPWSRKQANHQPQKVWVQRVGWEEYRFATVCINGRNGGEWIHGTMTMMTTMMMMTTEMI